MIELIQIELDYSIENINQQPRPKGTSATELPRYVVLKRYLYSGFNTFFNRPEGRGIKPLNTNNEYLKQVVKDTLAYYKIIGFVKPWISYLVKDNTKQFVGICSFKGKPKNNIVEIAYHTFSEYENNGFATEMCKELTRIAQNENKGIMITARTLPETNASTKVLLKNGFKNNGKINDPDDGEVFEWIL